MMRSRGKILFPESVLFRGAPWTQLAALLLLTFVNALLSFAPWSGWVKVPLFIVGVVGPLVLAAKTQDPSRGSASQEAFREGPRIPGGWIPWGVLLGLAAFLRFDRLTDLSCWPMFDESYFASFAVDYAREGKIHLVSGFTKVPPLLLMLEGLFFRVITPSLASLWLFSGLMGLATVLGAWGACRAFQLSRGWTFLFTALVAFNYWNLYSSRICIVDTFIPPFLFAALIGLAFMMRSRSDRSRTLLASLLGLLAALMLMSSNFLVPTILFLALGLLVLVRREGGRWRSLAVFVLAAGIPAALYVTHALTGGFTHQYLRYSYGSTGEFLRIAFPNAVQYVIAILWGLVRPDFFTPIAGGFLNPLLSAAFMLGVLDLIQRRSSFWARGLLGSIVFFMLWSLAFKHIEMFRVYGVMPFLLAAAALGLHRATSGRPAARRTLALLLLLALSTGFDAWRLLGPFGRWSVPTVDTPLHIKSLVQWRAHRTLEPFAEREGDGLVLERYRDDVESCEFLSLYLSTYPFNAATNPGLDPRSARWASLMTNLNYLPYLKARFPHARFRWLNPDMEGRQMLALIPREDFGPGRLDRLLEGERVLNRVFRKMLQLPDYPFHTREAMRTISGWLMEARPSLPDDPFVVSCWAQKLGVTAHDGGLFELMRVAVADGIWSGCPTAMHAYNRGMLQDRLGRREEAVRAFRSARNSPFDATPSHRYLTALGVADDNRTPLPRLYPFWEDDLVLSRNADGSLRLEAAITAP